MINQENKNENKNPAGEPLPPPAIGKEEKEQIYEEPNQCKWLVCSWLIMLAAIVLFIVVFLISHLGVDTQWSMAYTNSNYPVSPYYKSEGSSTCSFAITQTSFDMKGSDVNYRTPKAVAISLVLSWLMWKLPLCIFTLYLIWDNPSKVMKFVSFGISTAILIALDILLTVFVYKYWADYYYFAANFVFCLIVTIINNRQRIKEAALSVLPLVFIAVLVFLYQLFYPWLFGRYQAKVPQVSVYIQIYLFPLWDLLTYILLLVMNHNLPKDSKPFLATVRFLIMGYFVGITLLVGVTEVEFYYLVAYMLFRNFFTNWVMYKWEDTVNVHPCLPVWIVPYYLSYAFSFLPFTYLGRVAVSRSFFSQEFSQACMILFYYPTTEYPYNTTTPANSYNPKLRGFIFWVGAIVIWVVATFSQKYPRRKPTGFDFFFSVLGIYLFYIGISSGLELPVLSQVAFK